MADEIQHADGRVELRDPDRLRSSPLYNHDLAPCPSRSGPGTPGITRAVDLDGPLHPDLHARVQLRGERHVVVAGAADDPARQSDRARSDLANSHPGTKYGVPFPVLARASYGTVGSNSGAPARDRRLRLVRHQHLIGGSALQAFARSLYPGWDGLLGTFDGFPTTQWISFLAFWASTS